MIGVDGLPGDGPWIILPECEGWKHNTARAALRAKCTCPRALELSREYRDRENAKRRKNFGTPRPQVGRPRRRPPQSHGVPDYLANMRMDVPAPSLAGALCRSDAGIRIMDSGETRVIKAMCGKCPARVPCGDWARKGERIPGAWPGVYGGLTQVERREQRERGWAKIG